MATTSIIQEINQIEMQRPHLVILGTGASLAAFKNGDKNGKRLPLMNNFIDNLGLKTIINDCTLKCQTSNFEEIYSEVHENLDNQIVLKELERIIYEYFQSLNITDNPTIYDHLLLSLRDKDCIATFNWDPFLVQAYQRNAKLFKLPKLLFLHGNVSIGYCSDCHAAGLYQISICSKCYSPFLPTKLLYPIRKKNYSSDGFISAQWAKLKAVMNEAFMMTIFGYGAPSSDVEAINAMQYAWGSVDKRNMEQIEIIDIAPEDELSKRWEGFIHSHHYTVINNFYDSWIANHPRRTGEAYLNQIINIKYIENNPLPKNNDFSDLWKWFEPLRKVEINHYLNFYSEYKIFSEEK